MRRLRLLGTCAIGAVVWLNLAFPAVAQDALRPVVGTPLAKAKSLMAAHNYAAAQAQVAIADRQKGKTAYEDFVIQEMRGAIAQAAGDNATAAKVFGDIIATGRLGGEQLQQMLLAETSLSYQQKDYPATITWAQKYQKAGGRDPSIPTLITQSYFLQKDYANAARSQQAQIDATLKARKVPPEDQLQLLAACQKQIADNAGYIRTMQMLVTYYPKPDYWAQLVYGVQTKPGLSDRLELDLDRLQLHLGTLTRPSDYMQMIQLAMGENDPGGAQGVIAEAKDRKVFVPGPDSARQARLEGLVDKTAADTKASLDKTLKDLRGSPATTSQQLYELGQNFASFKQYDQGIGLMQEALDKGDLRRPALAQLRIGEAWVDAGQRANAIAAMQKVPATTDGTSDVAQLWLLWLRTQAKLQPTPH